MHAVVPPTVSRWYAETGWLPLDISLEHVLTLYWGDRRIVLREHMLHLATHPRFRFGMRENIELLVPDRLEHTVGNLIRRHPLLRGLATCLQHRFIGRINRQSPRIIAELDWAIALSVADPGVHPTGAEDRHLHFCAALRQFIVERFG